MKDVIKTPSFIRLAILTGLQALYDGFVFFIFAIVCYVAGSAVAPMNSDAAFRAAEAFALVFCALIPPVMGFFLADRPKWWIKSIPVQLLLGIVALYIFSYVALYDPNPTDDILFFGMPSFDLLLIISALFLALQAVGVGIKALWLNRRTRSRARR